MSSSAERAGFCLGFIILLLFAESKGALETGLEGKKPTAYTDLEKKHPKSCDVEI
jgi:hypothetical protein